MTTEAYSEQSALATERQHADELAKALDSAVFELGRVNRFAITDEMRAALARHAALRKESGT